MCVFVVSGGGGEFVVILHSFVGIVMIAFKSESGYLPSSLPPYAFHTHSQFLIKIQNETDTHTEREKEEKNLAINLKTCLKCFIDNEFQRVRCI